MVTGRLDLQARPRFRDGRTQAFVPVPVGSLVAEASAGSLDPNPVASTHGARIPRWISHGKIGVEISARMNPVPGSRPRFSWEILDFAERFPTTFQRGMLVVLRVGKRWSDRWPSLGHRACTLANPKHPLNPGAKLLAS